MLLLTTACTPAIKLKVLQDSKNATITEAFEPFAFIEEDTLPQLSGLLLGEVEIGSRLLTVDCDYEAVKQLAVKEARKLGGNCLLVKTHQFPDQRFRCHRIKGEIWSLEDPGAYEKIITWHPQRRLSIEDFKGDTLNRPFQAVTSSALHYYTKVNRITGFVDLYIESLFNCELSYFVASEYDSLVLEHEQLHFDITEIFAREFCERLQTECASYTDFASKHERIYREIEQALAQKQKEYDSEVNKEDTLQKRWVVWVAEELRATAAFANKQIRF